MEVSKRTRPPKLHQPKLFEASVLICCILLGACLSVYVPLMQDATHDAVPGRAVPGMQDRDGAALHQAPANSPDVLGQSQSDGQAGRGTASRAKRDLESVGGMPAAHDGNRSRAKRQSSKPAAISLLRLRGLIERAESSDRTSAVGDDGRAIGLLQIWRITVDDANRILGEDQYTYADRWCPVKSREMFGIVVPHYANHNADWTAEGITRRWNHGPDGHIEKRYSPTWEKVKGWL